MKKLRDDITAFILCGGKSSRMGTNKAFLKIDDKTLIQRMMDLIDTIFSKIVISSNEPELYESFRKKIIKDIYQGRGPVSGIHSALTDLKTEKCFFISCDMPFISRQLINYLINYNSDKEIILPKADGRLQQLCGIYSKKILPDVDKLIIESMLEGSQLKGSIYELLNRIEPEIVDVTRQNFYHQDLFFNINTPEDYDYAKRIQESESR